MKLNTVAQNLDSFIEANQIPNDESGATLYQEVQNLREQIAQMQKYSIRREEDFQDLIETAKTELKQLQTELQKQQRVNQGHSNRVRVVTPHVSSQNFQGQLLEAQKHIQILVQQINLLHENVQSECAKNQQLLENIALLKSTSKAKSAKNQQDLEIATRQITALQNEVARLKLQFQQDLALSSPEHRLQLEQIIKERLKLVEQQQQPLSQPTLDQTLVLRYSGIGDTGKMRLKLLFETFQAFIEFNYDSHLLVQHTNFSDLSKNKSQIKGILLLGLEQLLSDGVELILENPEVLR